MKERIRDRLKMIENNLDNFNEFSLTWIDKKKIKRMLSVWRWYVSHDYFNEKHKKPQKPASNPPLGFLYSQIQGQSVPLARDVGMCIAPVVQSSLMTEHAARRIMNRLNMIYGYVSQEDALADQQIHRDREDKKLKDRRRAQKAVVDRKAERKLEQQKLIKKIAPRVGKERMKKKDTEREEERTRRRLAAEETRRLAIIAKDKMLEDMKERRK